MRTTVRFLDRRNGVAGRYTAILAVMGVVLSAPHAWAQCGAGGNFSGDCVNLVFRPAVQTTFVGATVEVGVYAVSVNLFSQPLQFVDLILNWDSTKLELRGHKTCKGGVNNGKPCVSSTECGSGISCGLDCEAGESPNCYFCPANAGAGTPDSYNWVLAAYPNDSALDGLNADCTPTAFCNPYSGRPYNDGEAFFDAVKQVQCSGSSAPPPLATPAGTLVAKFRFKVLTAGSTQVSLKPSATCTLRQRTCDPNSANPNLPCTTDADCGGRTCLGGATPGAPCVSDLQCPPDGFCPVLCKACEAAQCCTTETGCSVCSFADTRVVGGTSFGIDVTAALGAPANLSVSACAPPTVSVTGSRYLAVKPDSNGGSMALKVTGVETDVACVTGWVQSNGTVSTNPFYQSPAAWGTVSVRGLGLISSRTYQVQADCAPANPGTALSAPASGKLWKWGDVDNSGGLTDVIDLVNTIDAFRGVLDDLTLPCTTNAQCTTRRPNFECHVATGLCYKVKKDNADVIGPAGANRCLPDNTVDIVDIVTVLDEFSGRTQPCPPPC